MFDDVQKTRYIPSCVFAKELLQLFMVDRKILYKFSLMQSTPIALPLKRAARW